MGPAALVMTWEVQAVFWPRCSTVLIPLLARSGKFSDSVFRLQMNFKFNFALIESKIVQGVN